MGDARESNHQQSIIKLIRRRGGWVVATTRLAPVMRGIPDMIVCYKGVSLFIEAKGERTTFQKLQQYQHMKLRRAGAVVIVARGRGGVDLVETVLDHIDGAVQTGTLADVVQSCGALVSLHGLSGRGGA